PRDLRRCGRAAELLAQRRDRAVELEVELLEPARHAHRPSLVAEVSLQLSGDRRRGEGGELQAPWRLEALDRLEQPDERDLSEIVERLAPVGEPAREELGQPEIVLDQPV